MSVSYFLHNANVSLMWDVIADEDVFKNTSLEFKKNVFQLFTANLNEFYKTEHANTTQLVDLNKKYILLVMNYITTIVARMKQADRSTDAFSAAAAAAAAAAAPMQQLVTFEDIQNDRKSKFEQDLCKRQEEFTSSMSSNAPPLPNFSDTMSEHEDNVPVEQAVQNIIAQRNYDVDQLRQRETSPGKWLNSQETSLKKDKLQQQQQQQQQSSVVQHIQIDTSSLLETSAIKMIVDLNLNDSSQKKVTWGADELFEHRLQEDVGVVAQEEVDVFKLFKKLKMPAAAAAAESSNQEVTASTSLDKMRNDIDVLTIRMDRFFEWVSKNTNFQG